MGPRPPPAGGCCDDTLGVNATRPTRPSITDRQRERQRMNAPWKDELRQSALWRAGAVLVGLPRRRARLGSPTGSKRPQMYDIHLARRVALASAYHRQGK